MGTISRAIATGIVLSAVLWVTACSSAQTEESPTNEVRMPAASEDLEGEAYGDVVAILEEAGFTDIETVALGDLITGWLNKPDTVDEVEIDGVVSFDKGERFEPDVRIVINYHSFPERDEENDAVPGDETTTGSTPESDAPMTPTLTVDNSPELAALLTGTDFGPSVAAFAEKYDGQLIEFNGAIFAMNNHGSYKTRYDILILSGDYNPVSGSGGPTFQFRDVNITSDLRLTGDIPDTIGVGANLHIVAEVIEYSADNGLFQLKPVETRVR